MSKIAEVSEITRAGRILRLEILSASPRAWVKDPLNPLNQLRTVSLKVQIIETLKGSPAEKVVEFQAEQRRPASGRIAEDYGPWSEADLAPNRLFLGFFDGPDRSLPLETALAKHCQLLVTEEDPAYPHAVQDVRRAMTLKADPNFPALLRTETFQQTLLDERGHSGPLFMRFLVEQADQLAPPPFELLFRFLDAPDAIPAARVVVLDYLRNFLSLAEQPPPELPARFAGSMFRILGQSAREAAVLQEGIRQAYLYNGVFDPSGKPRFSAKDALPDRQDRMRALNVIGSISNPERGNQLRSWILQADE